MTRSSGEGEPDDDLARRQGPGKGEGAGVTYLQAVVIALIQGVTELFPVSSLGHSVLVPAWIGGSW